MKEIWLVDLDRFGCETTAKGNVAGDTMETTARKLADLYLLSKTKPEIHVISIGSGEAFHSILTI